MSQDLLVESLRALGSRRREFAEDVLADLRARHPGTLADGVDPERLMSALDRFAAAPDEADPGVGDAATPRAVAFADSVMKVFANRLGRAAWKPGMALTWNASLRRAGDQLLRSLD